MTKYSLDRRSLLRGFGFAGLTAHTLLNRRDAMAAGASPPRRLILFYTPGGFFSPCFQPDEAWTGDNVGKSVDLPLAQVTLGKMRGGKRQNVLDWLDDPKYASLRSDLLVLDGIDMRSVERSDEHHNGIKAALRGRPIATDDAGPFPNWSVDRVIGANLFPNGDRPVHLKSACLNVGLGSFGYQGSIRDAAEGGTALEPTSTGQLWDMLFKDFQPGVGGMTTAPGPSLALVDVHERRRLLTAHSRSEIDTVKRLLGKDEQLALDRHLEAMNELSLQVENARKAASAPGGVALSKSAAIPARPGAALDPKRDLPALCTEAVNIVAQGMAFDRTRVAVLHTFGQNNNTSYWYPGATGAYHNGVCHGGTKTIGGQTACNDDALSAGRTLMKMYLDILLKLKSIPEGDGTLLDSTTVATFSDMSHGDHGYRNPTLFVLGGGGGLTGGKRHFRTGRYMKFLDRGHTDYLISLAHGIGVTETKSSAGDRRPFVQIGSARYNKGPLSGLT